MDGELVLASTPIGNTDDASPRLREALAGAHVVAAEDTRRLRDLARRLGVTIGGEVVAVHDHNERDRAEGLVARVLAGETVVVVSDAGTPTISDPGVPLVQAAIAAGAPVTTIPGPSAALAALAVSGLPTDRFTFEGFLPRKAGPRSAALAGLAREPRTMVFFEAPHRVAATLSAMAGAFGGDRPAAVCRELTKTYEETRRAPLTELAAWAAEGDGPRGEIVVVVAGAPAGTVDVDALAAEALDRASAGERLKDAAADVAEAGGASTRDVYEAAIAQKASDG